jgi:hypothetical protein
MRTRISLLVAILAFACATPAQAQLNKEIVGPAETLSTPGTVPPGTVPPEASPAEPGAPPLAKGADQTDLLVVPIPISNPAIDTGLTVAAVWFYNPQGEPQSNNVNLRLDIAFGKDGKAVYFGIGEQF